MIRVAVLVLAGCAAAATFVAVSGDRPAQDPPFPSGEVLSGSMVFDHDPNNPNAGDWDVTADGQAPEIDFRGTGIYIYPGSGTVANASVQHRLEFTPTSGVNAWAKFRVRLDHGDNIETLFGFFSTDSNPFSGEPDVIAAFDTDKHIPEDDKFDLYAVVKKSGQSSNRLLLWTDISKYEFLDCVVKVEGTSKVLFWFKASTAITWNGPEEVPTTALPDGPMRFSAAVQKGNDNAHLDLHVFEFEIQR